MVEHVLTFTAVPSHGPPDVGRFRRLDRGATRWHPSLLTYTCYEETFTRVTVATSNVMSTQL